tara:strand:+ start:457 stop:738 length:282 start_codon:yes stop_codon:yes gene_type:complete
MTRYHATPNGNVPFTPEEEAEWDLMEAEYAAGADDRAAEEVRTKRDLLLAETDWHGMSDVTMSTEMATYRQALRDISTQTEFPNEINWPTKPE